MNRWHKFCAGFVSFFGVSILEAPLKWMYIDDDSNVWKCYV